MTTITLESIESEHARIGEMISDYRRQQAERSVIYIPEQTVALKHGELYAGILLNDDGSPSHHVVVLPDDVAGMQWDQAKAWALEQGGELPTRREQSLMFANLKSHFEGTWYWSAEEYEPDTAYAWSQNFGNGGQNNHHKSYYYCRARAVRRLVIE